MIRETRNKYEIFSFVEIQAEKWNPKRSERIVRSLLRKIGRWKNTEGRRNKKIKLWKCVPALLQLFLDDKETRDCHVQSTEKINTFRIRKFELIENLRLFLFFSFQLSCFHRHPSLVLKDIITKGLWFWYIFLHTFAPFFPSLFRSNRVLRCRMLISRERKKKLLRCRRNSQWKLEISFRWCYSFGWEEKSESGINSLSFPFFFHRARSNVVVICDNIDTIRHPTFIEGQICERSTRTTLSRLWRKFEIYLSSLSVLCWERKKFVVQAYYDKTKTETFQESTRRSRLKIFKLPPNLSKLTGVKWEK